MIKFLFSVFLLIPFSLFSQQGAYKQINDNLLANNKPFSFWEQPNKFVKTYYVDGSANNASDENTGTIDAPFKTINKAASVLKAGERVIIKGGVYREAIYPVNGGESPSEMICYEAAQGENVIIKGSVELNKEKWENDKYYRYGMKSDSAKAKVLKYKFDGAVFQGYNPFGMVNLMHDRAWLEHKKEVKIFPHFKRRGMVFVNGQMLEQVELPDDLGNKFNGAFWPEHNGLTIHVRFPEGLSPENAVVEVTTKEQLFVPEHYGLGYIHLKGLQFEHVGNGFPVPQRGMVSTNRGHHWIIEHCRFSWANSVGIDMGKEIWGIKYDAVVGFNVFRNNVVENCGISGLQGMGAVELLIEDNLFQKIGWQDAELAFESGAIKIHQTYNTLIRRNIIRDISFAPGIWLDYLSNRNCRLTKNVFIDITTARGAVYIEVSHNHCRVDHNVFYGTRSQYWLSGDYGAGGSALYTDGSDSINFDHNLMVDIENTGYGAYLNADRMVVTRGGTTRRHAVTHNIFSDCRKVAVEMANEFNYLDGNIYSDVPAGYIRIGNPLPVLKLDVNAVKDIYGWEKTGQFLTRSNHIKINFNKTDYSMEVILPQQYQNKSVEVGPFMNYNTVINIDPRKKY
jgi:hypothetical protein